MDIFISEGLIQSVHGTGQKPIPSGYTTIPASGLFIVPGLIDSHVHYSQTGWIDGRPDVYL